MNAPVAYLDSSATLKLVFTEPETAALRGELPAWPRQVSSQLTSIEIERAVRRRDPKRAPRLSDILAGIHLRPIDREVVKLAERVAPASLRSLDAIHLATALLFAREVDVFVAYDRRLLDAARRAGFATASPA